MASSVAKAESTTEIKCNPQKFYEMIKCNLHHLPAIYPEGYTDGKILEGDGQSVGSLRMWKYILPGTTEEMFVKARTTKQDDKNMIMVLFVEEGSVHDHHTHFVVTVQVTPKGPEAASVTWTMEYKKKGADSPDPHLHFELFKNLNEKVAAHVVANK